MKQISFCEEDCEISSTLARTLRGGGKCAADDVGQAHNSGPADGDERNVADGGERFHAAARAAALRRDFRAGIFRLEGIANPYRNSRLHHGAQRLRMQNFRAEIGELGGLAIGNFGDRAGFGNQARIGAEHAVHVRPDDDFVRAERAAQNRGGIIRASAAERGENAVGGRADEIR